MTVWRVATAMVLAVGLMSSAEPASAEPSSAAEAAHEAKVAAIVSTTDPDLREVLVTRRDDEGRPTFETISTPTKAKAAEVVDRLLGARGVVSVEMNQVVTAAGHGCRRKGKVWNRKKKRCVRRPVVSGAPDPLRVHQWALDAGHLNLDGVTAQTAGDTRPVYVAVIDSGVNWLHPDLRGRVDTVVSAFGGSGIDDFGHGTHVAGAIAAATNNGIGVAGFDRTAVLRSVKVLDSNGEGSSESVASGITWAAQNADVLNLSLAATQSSPAMQNAVNYALGLGRTVVAAAGNLGNSCSVIFGCQAIYPAAYDGVIGVAAVDQYGSRAGFSSYGSWVDVAAPGVGILSTCIPADYCYMSGTSMATPFVSALAAMTISHCGAYGTDVSDRITRWASAAPSRDNYVGYGVIRPTQVLTCG